jgi:hypothetical protein
VSAAASLPAYRRGVKEDGGPVVLVAVNPFVEPQSRDRLREQSAEIELSLLERSRRRSHPHCLSDRPLSVWSKPTSGDRRNRGDERAAIFDQSFAGGDGAQSFVAIAAKQATLQPRSPLCRPGWIWRCRHTRPCRRTGRLIWAALALVKALNLAVPSLAFATCGWRREALPAGAISPFTLTAGSLSASALGPATARRSVGYGLQTDGHLHEFLPDRLLGDEFGEPPTLGGLLRRTLLRSVTI